MTESESESTDRAGPVAPNDDELTRVYSAAFRVARRNGLNTHDAEDVAQASTAVVWANWSVADSPIAYVSTVAERAAWAVRGAYTTTPRANTTDDTSILDLASDIVGCIYIADLLASLPPQQARTIDLHYLQGLSIGEVAAHLGVAINTVKTHNRLALQRLRTDLDDRRDV